MDAMRIALATSSYAPYVGGVEEHVANVARVLRARGHEVVVWTVARDGRFAVREHESVEVWDLPTPLPARSIPAMLGFVLRFPGAWRRWRRASRRLRPDVIHVHCFGPNGTYARLLAGRTRTPLVVTGHGETVADDAGVFQHSRLAQDSLTRALADAVAVTGCSHVVLADLEARFGLAPGRGEVVPNGIDPDEAVTQTAIPAARGRYVAALGRVQRVKGFDLLVEAFARADIDPEVTLVIGGDGPERAPLAAQAERLGVADRVILPGRLDRGQVAALLGGAAAVVVPSRFEAFGIAALEAWRAGAALIATNRGGPPEFVRDGIDGLLVDPEDTDALARAITEVIRDPARAASLGDAGLLRLPEFTWERVAGQYEEIYLRANDRSPDLG